jgi:hypothetical protein
MRAIARWVWAVGGAIVSLDRDWSDYSEVDSPSTQTAATPWDNGTLALGFWVRFGLLQQPVHDVGIDEALLAVGEGEG